MKTIAIIPARGESKGIPMKNLALLNGKPLLYYTVKASLDTSFINRTVVSTDNAKISHEAKKLGAEVIPRPRELSADKIAIEPVMDYTLSKLEESEGYVPDTVILLQNTSPLRTAKHIDNAVKFFNEKKYDSVLSGYPSHHLFWKYEHGIATPLNYNPLKRINRQQMKNQFVENGAIYITKYHLFKKNKCRISGRIGLYEMPEELSIQIDSEYDLLFAQEILKRRNRV
ncbi:MAG: cytidylyltransferase domain-containing protein [Nitrosopumilaceae archaeon]